MRITAYSDYSLRLLMYLAISPDGRGTISEVAERYDISRAHVMKVAHQLGRAGYVETIRGRAGGLRLARPPEVIRVGEVLRLTESDFNMVPCFESGKLCVITPSCVLKRALAEATRAFLATLDGYTLADLAAPEAALRRDLGLAAP
jgi:Rrf2 family transcriptional regulator, nitric oxide-sensitive transcriptional repressor